MDEHRHYKFECWIVNIFISQILYIFIYLKKKIQNGPIYFSDFSVVLCVQCSISRLELLQHFTVSYLMSIYGKNLKKYQNVILTSTRELMQMILDYLSVETWTFPLIRFLDGNKIPNFILLKVIYFRKCNKQKWWSPNI